MPANGLKLLLRLLALLVVLLLVPVRLAPVTLFAPLVLLSRVSALVLLFCPVVVNSIRICLLQDLAFSRAACAFLHSPKFPALPECDYAGSPASSAEILNIFSAENRCEPASCVFANFARVRAFRVRVRGVMANLTIYVKMFKNVKKSLVS